MNFFTVAVIKLQECACAQSRRIDFQFRNNNATESTNVNDWQWVAVRFMKIKMSSLCGDYLFMCVLNAQDASGTEFQRQGFEVYKEQVLSDTTLSRWNSLSKYGKEYAAPTISPFFDNQSIQ